MPDPELPIRDDVCLLEEIEKAKDAINTLSSNRGVLLRVMNHWLDYFVKVQEFLDQQEREG